MERSTNNLVLEHRGDQYDWCAFAVEHGLLVGVHVGNEARIQRSRAQFLAPTVRDHCVIRDTENELSGGMQILDIQARTGCRLSVLHLSTPELGWEIKRAQQQGRTVAAEICPHHWCFTAEELAREDGAFFKMNPPLRSPEQVATLQSEFLSQGDVITRIATDHAPHTKAEKQQTDYDCIPSGVPGVQEMLPLGLDLVSRGVLTLDRLIDLTARNPARELGFHNKGELKQGADADVVLVDLEGKTTFTHESSLSKCGWTPYDQMSVHGAIKLVIAKGKIQINNLQAS